MSSIIDALLAAVNDLPDYEVVDSFELKPVRVIHQDYTPVILMRMSWCNGHSKKAVVHARCDRQVGNRQKGEILCGYKSKAKYGGNHFTVSQEITCPKCKKLTKELSESLLAPSAYGWLS